MTKKEKKENKLKAKIKEMKKTPKGAAIVKLIGWIIFFVFLFIFCFISSLITSVVPPQTKQDEKVPINEPIDEPNTSLDIYNLDINNLISLEQKLLNNGYRYEYKININAEKYIFNGNHSANIDTGYKESSTGIIKYYVDLTGAYQETTNEKILISNLYEGLNSNYFDLTYIFGLINTLELTRDLECDCSYPVYKMEDTENIYRISINDNFITAIDIISKNDNYSYNLNYISEGE